MARMRTLKPEFFTNEQLGPLAFEWRLLFAGLWTQADRCGRLEDRPARLKAVLFPYDHDLDIDAGLAQLERAGLILRYKARKMCLICVPSWDRNQHPHHTEAPSVLPPPMKTRTKEHRALTVRTPLKNGASRVDQDQDQDQGTDQGAEEVRTSEGVRAPTPPEQNTPKTKPLAAGVPWHVAYQGTRLAVPRHWHEQHVTMAGTDDPEARLRAWYATLDAQLVRTQAPVGNWFKWLDKRFASWEADEEDAAHLRELEEANRRFDEQQAAIDARRNGGQP